MWHILVSLARALSIVVTLPVAIAADLITIGGFLIERHEPHVFTAILDFVENVLEMGNPHPEFNLAFEPEEDEQDH